MNAERAKTLFFDLAWLILLGIALLIVGVPYAFVFPGIGGGWALYGPNDCRFEIGPIGYVMLVPPIFVLAGAAWLVRRHFRSAA